MIEVVYKLKIKNEIIVSNTNKNKIITYISPIEQSLSLSPKQIGVHFVSSSKNHDFFMNLLNTSVQLLINVNYHNSINEIVLFSGYIEQISTTYYGNQVLIKLIISDYVSDLNRTIIRYYSPEEQKRKYPIDKCFDFIGEIRFRISLWGKMKIT